MQLYGVMPLVKKTVLLRFTSTMVQFSKSLTQQKTETEKLKMQSLMKLQTATDSLQKLNGNSQHVVQTLRLRPGQIFILHQTQILLQLHGTQTIQMAQLMRLQQKKQTALAYTI